MSTPAKNDIPTASAAGLIADLARAGTAPEIVNIPTEGLGGGLPPLIPALWDRGNQRLLTAKDEIERYRQGPARIIGTAKVDTLESFIELTKRHGSADSTIFAATAWPNPALTTVVDYHKLDHNTGWGQHRICYAFPLTEEFKAWVDKNKATLTQNEFAEFLEEHSAELAVPFEAESLEYERLFKMRFALPNELIELSRHLEINVGSKVKQQTRLQSGERQIVFQTEHTNAAGEAIDIPGIFMISVQPFVDGDLVRIPARIRYRVAGGDVVWSYQMYRWEYWLRTRVQNDLLKASTDTGLPAYEGHPEA